MTVQHIKKEVLKLDANSRARLASVLLSSLDDLSDAENEKLWSEEALRRHENLMNGRAKSRSASLVFKEARSRLK
jgi:hypothetical protein